MLILVLFIIVPLLVHNAIVLIQILGRCQPDAARIAIILLFDAVHADVVHLHVLQFQFVGGEQFTAIFANVATARNRRSIALNGRWFWSSLLMFLLVLAQEISRGMGAVA